MLVPLSALRPSVAICWPKLSCFLECLGRGRRRRSPRSAKAPPPPLRVMATVAISAEATRAQAAAKRPREEAPGDDAAPPSPRRRCAGAATVGDLVGCRATVVCGNASTLADAAELLLVEDRSAVAVVGEDGALLGALTENDIVRAYCADALPTCSVGEWLFMHMARLPHGLVDLLTVRPSATLLEAAAMLRGHADSENAFRHLVVRDEDGGLLGILSSMDLARALCSACPDQEVVRRIGRSTTAEVMKPRAALPVCGREVTLARALQQINTSRQNCVLVVDGAARTLGVVTPRDALRAYAEQVPMSVEVGNWLRFLESGWAQRAVQREEPVQGCAARMVERAVHHLMVLDPCGDVAGVVSSTDLARALGAADHVAA